MIKLKEYIVIPAYNEERSLGKVVDDLRKNGSRLDANTKAEGIVVYHVAGDLYFKATCENDESHKGQSE